MTAERFFELFQQYGLALVFVVIFLEYMNLPGFPAGVIMPSIGVLVQQSRLSLVGTLLLSEAAGVLGSLVIYGLCYWGGEPLMHRLFGKSQKFIAFVGRCHSYMNKHRGRGLALCRIIPVLRTIVSIPAGLLRMPLREYVLWSALGIAVWNSALIGFGYLGGGVLLGAVG